MTALLEYIDLHSSLFTLEGYLTGKRYDYIGTDTETDINIGASLIVFTEYAQLSGPQVSSSSDYPDWVMTVQ